MPSTFLSFVPQHVAADILKHPNAAPTERAQQVQVVALFADVSGFTAITEALGKTGRSGTEALTTLINRYFERMIDLIKSYDGIVSKFGGDAMTILFPYIGETEKRVVQDAVRAALAMQAAMHHYESIPTSAGEFSLTAKIGLAKGRVLCTSVGDLAIRLEYIIAGRVLDDCAEAEHHAVPGEIVVHDALLPYLDGITEVEKREGFTCISGEAEVGTRNPPPDPPLIPPHLIDTFAAYLHPTIADRIRAGLTGFINEHRKITVLFVRFDGFDYDDDPEAAAKLQRYFAPVIRTIHHYDGYLNKIDMGDKGSKYIVIFGAPVAHEDDETRALRCALDLQQLPGVEGVQIGISTGLAYCGQVGSTQRQEYTVMGDTAVLAARLMTTAKPGQILTSRDTFRADSGRFQWKEHPPVLLKGKSEPTPIRILTGAEQRSHRAPSYRLPLVGRQHERDIASAALAQVKAGRGKILGITAEAGLGKSRLAAHIMGEAAAQGYKIFTGECESYGTKISYLPWRAIWQDFFGLSIDAAVDAQISQLRERLTALDPAFVQRMPLLGPAVNLSIPDSLFTESLEGQVRLELLETLLLDCLRAEHKTVPLLLVLEDCHWLDPLSESLLNYITRNIVDTPVLVLVVYRPPVTDDAFPTTTRTLPYFEELTLSEFTDTEAETFVQSKVVQLYGEEQAASPNFIQRINQRAQGNPFYIEELLTYIHDRGYAPDNPRIFESVALPDSLHSLVISRIDRLAESEKLTIKVASVIGRLFRARWLWGSYPQLGQPAAIARQLHDLTGQELIIQDKPEPEVEYLFKHIITQEVAYESLAYATRAQLHEGLGGYIEASYPDTLDNFLDLLAYHYSKGRNLDKRREYLRKAGDRARGTYANAAAIDYYRRLLPLLDEDEKTPVLRALGEVLQFAGQWPDAEATFRQALQMATQYDQMRERAWCHTALGHLLSFSESPAAAQSVLEKARADFEVLDDRYGLSRSLKYLAIAYAQQGHHDQAHDCAESQLKVAESRGDRIGISEANMNLAWIYSEQGELERARDHLQTALARAQEAEYPYGEVVANSDLAGVYHELGDYAQAVICCLDAYRISKEIGFLQGAGTVISNVGEIYRHERDLKQALACYAEALRVGLQIGNLFNITFILGNIAAVFAAQHQGDAAMPVFEQAIRLARVLNIPYALCESLLYQAELYAAQGNTGRAHETNYEAATVASVIERKDIAFRCDMLAVEIGVRAGDVTAHEGARQLLALAQDSDSPSEQAAASYAAWKHDPDLREARTLATERYREQYSQTPTVEAYQCLRELIETDLDAPPPLPGLGTEIRPDPDALATLLKQVEPVIAASIGG